MGRIVGVEEPRHLPIAESFSIYMLIITGATIMASSIGTTYLYTMEPDSSSDK